MTSALNLAAVAAGAALGGCLRYAAGVALQGSGPGFPWATLLVNAIGGLLVGLALVAFERAPNEGLRLFVVTGFLGGLTTFSAFSAESLTLLQQGQWLTALLHAAAHLGIALTLAAAGFALGRWIWA